MKHWGKPKSEHSKFPAAVCKTIFPDERKELDRQEQHKLLAQKHNRLPRMPMVKK